MKGQLALLVHRHLSPFRLTSLDHPLDHNTCSLERSFNQNTLWIVSFSGLGAAFMLSLRLSAADVAPIVCVRKMWCSRSPGSPFVQAHSRIVSFYIIFSVFRLDIFTLSFY